MATNTKKEMRNGCVPNHGCIYLWKRTSKKEEGAAVKGKVVLELMEDKKHDHLYEKLTIKECLIREDIEDKSPVVQYGSSSASKNGSFRVKEAAAKGKEVLGLITVESKRKSYEKLTIEKCWMSEDVEGSKSPVEYNSNISNANGSLRGKEATDERPEKVAEMCRNKDEDAEFKIAVEEELLVHESNKNSSLLEEEENAGETKEMADENRVNESLTVVEIQKDEKPDELKLIVKSESVIVNRTQAEHDPTQYQARPPRPIWQRKESTQGTHFSRNFLP